MVGDTPLLDLVEQPLNLLNSYKLVKDYWKKNEGWKWEEIQSFLPQNVLSELMSILLRDDEAKSDFLCWSLLFFVKNANPTSHIGCGVGLLVS